MLVPVTSHDVARLAGVSQSTVSRVLRGQRGLSASTRQRVHEAAESLGYVPLETGRALSTRATRRIGVVADELTNPFYPQLIEPMRAQLQRAGYRLVLVPDNEDVTELTRGSVDGVVFTTIALDSPLPAALSDRGVPFVMVNRVADDVSADVCVADNRVGAAMAAELIANLGHRSVAMLGGPVNASTARERERGFRDSLLAHGIELRPEHRRAGPFSYATGYQATRELVRNPDAPTAIFCANDVLALGACNAAKAEGLRLGRDLTVIGFDDIPMAGWEVFDLTTIRCDLTAMAKAAIRLLLRRISQPSAEIELVTVDAEIVPRSTHGPVASAALRLNSDHGTIPGPPTPSR